MPGWAGSSQYFNRYMDPHNREAIYSEEAIYYWEDVDLYIGGSEHATGHLLYSRFWQKFLFDRGVAAKEEFAKKLINQGMITGTSAFVYRMPFGFGGNKKGIKYNWVSVPRVFVSKSIQELYDKLVLRNKLSES